MPASRRATKVISVLTVSVLAAGMPVLFGGCDSTTAVVPPVETTHAGGKPQFDRVQHDFGVVEPDSRHSTVFTLTNVGKDLLEIGQTDASCGCTVPVLQTKSLPPGGSMDITVNYHAKSNPGPYTNWVDLYFKTPSQQEKQRLQLTSEVVRYLSVKPQWLSIEARDNAAAPVLVIESGDEMPFHVKGVSSTGNAVTALFDPEVLAQRHELNLMVDPDKLHELTNGVVSILTDHPRAASANVNFNVVQPFVARPQIRTIFDGVPGQSRRSSVTIVSSFNEAFELGDVSSRDGHITVVNQEKTQNGYRIDFDFNLPADGTNASLKDELIVPIKDRPNDTVKITCNAIFARQPAPQVSSSAGSGGQ